MEPPQVSVMLWSVDMAEQRVVCWISRDVLVKWAGRRSLCLNAGGLVNLSVHVCSSTGPRGITPVHITLPMLSCLCVMLSEVSKMFYPSLPAWNEETAQYFVPAMKFLINQNFSQFLFYLSIIWLSLQIFEIVEMSSETLEIIHTYFLNSRQNGIYCTVSLCSPCVSCSIFSIIIRLNGWSRIERDIQYLLL